jgi:hypothetical protein
MEHSGCKKAIEHIEVQVSDHDTRIRAIEKTVWQASALTGFFVLVGQALIQHYWK